MASKRMKGGRLTEHERELFENLNKENKGKQYYNKQQQQNKQKQFMNEWMEEESLFFNSLNEWITLHATIAERSYAERAAFTASSAVKS